MPGVRRRNHIPEYRTPLRLNPVTPLALLRSEFDLGDMDAIGPAHCKTPEEFKAWPQNRVHDDGLTAFASCGTVSVHKQAEIIPGSMEERADLKSAQENSIIAGMEALIARVKNDEMAV